MNGRVATWLTILTLYLAQSPAWSQPASKYQAPKEFASLTELRAWLEKNKGFGVPQTVESKLHGLHVFVAWNSPFSGRRGFYSWAYVNRAKAGRWQLLDSSFFEHPETLSFAYVDGQSERLQYIGVKGTVLKSVPLNEVRFK
ncbi:MAG TPA: hypothetical protein VKJ47_15630 [Candidatus Binatia bacterium]|nr:hypothetical protein [Candidatus Binatia bacterium]